MKKLILSLAVLSVSLVGAQKKEIANAVKAIDAGDTATAKSEISRAEAIFGDKTYLLEPAVLEQYYYAKGISLLKDGKTTEGAEYLAKIRDLGSQPIFSGKDSDKNKVYFVGKTEADKSGIAQLKQDKYELTLMQKILDYVSPIYTKAYETAINDYNSKNYTAAAEGFKKVYYLTGVVGNPDESILLNAGLSYRQAENDKDALDVYKTLINKGYTGVKTTYTAVNVKNNKTETLGKETFETFKKLGDASGYKDFKSETSKNIENELYETYMGLLVQNKDYDEAATFADKAIAKFPTDNELIKLKGLAYVNSGKANEYVAILKNLLEKNPNDKDSLYNLGVIYSSDPSKQADAEDAFKKLVNIDPKYPNALYNLVFTIVGDDGKAIENIKALRKDGKDDQASKLQEARRARFDKALPYVEQLYQNEPDNKDNVTLLKNFYITTQQTDTQKYKDLKAKEAAMKQ